MKVLPKVPVLSPQRLRRRHKPPVRPYSYYRDCLAWEFGFFCSFCNLHEADFNEHGFAGTRTMWIEHYQLQSDRPGEKNAYANCFYSCHYCNHDRRSLPARRKDRAKLLNPCQVAWADHFTVEGPKLLPKTPSAEYTEQAYNLNDPRKIQMRENRQEALDDAWAVWDEIGPVRNRILDHLQRLAPTPDNAALLTELENSDRPLRLAVAQLRRFAAIPQWASHQVCGCSEPCVIPAYLEPHLREWA